MKKFLILSLILVCLVGSVSALEMPPVKQGENVILRQTCGSCSYVNISIYYPNSTIAVLNDAMTNSGGGFWEYAFTETNEVGRYDYPTCADIGGVYTCSDSNNPPFFYVTGNGNESPEGVVILGFILLMLVVFVCVTVYLIKVVGLMIEGNVDILDIGYAWGLFFGVLGLNLFAGIYLGNAEVTEFLELFIKILAFPLVVVPVLAFFLSLFRAKKEKKRRADAW